MDLTEAEDTKKRWQEYTEELYKKDLHDPDNHDDVITHPKPDILEREVKWALGSELENTWRKRFVIMNMNTIVLHTDDSVGIIFLIPTSLGFTMLRLSST